MKIAFIGISNFGKIILEELIKRNYPPDLAITSFEEDWELKIRDLNPELIIIADETELPSKEILTIPKYGCFHLHPSLLPRWRGPFPIQTTILAKDSQTGVTIVLVSEEIDRGPILAQRKIEIEAGDTSKTLFNRLAELGTRLLLETIPRWQRGLIKPKPQEEEKVTFSKILTEGDGKIIWRKTAEELEREIRAFDLWPGSYTFWEKKGRSIKLKILKARVYKFPGGVPYPIGKTLIVPNNEIGVQCGRGFLPGKGDFLVIERLQLDGEKEMSSEEFIQTHLDFIGTILK